MNIHLNVIRGIYAEGSVWNVVRWLFEIVDERRIYFGI